MVWGKWHMVNHVIRTNLNLVLHYCRKYSLSLFLVSISFLLFFHLLFFINLFDFQQNGTDLGLAVALCDLIPDAKEKQKKISKKLLTILKVTKANKNFTLI